ncbi:MAG: cobalamin-binding protein [Rhodospirillaceae bacterium]
MRIVSLIASATEIISALGAQNDLVGRSHECDWPFGVEGLPALTRARFDTKQNSLEIDRAVKDIVKEGLSVYDVDHDLLKALAPDLIVTQDQCEVCAASLDDVEAALCEWIEHDIKIISLHPNTLEDVFADIHKVSRAISREGAAVELTQQMTEKLESLTSSSTASQSEPSVFMLEWIEPAMAAGHWIPTLVEAAGGRNLITKEGEPSPYVSWESISDCDPDLIVVAPCGFDVERTITEMETLRSHEIWNSLRAVKSGKVAVMDGNRYINRPSPAVVESAAMLADIMWEHSPKNGPRAWRWLETS